MPGLPGLEGLTEGMTGKRATQGNSTAGQCTGSRVVTLVMSSCVEDYDLAEDRIEDFIPICGIGPAATGKSRE